MFQPNIANYMTQTINRLKGTRFVWIDLGRFFDTSAAQIAPF